MTVCEYNPHDAHVGFDVLLTYASSPNNNLERLVVECNSLQYCAILYKEYLDYNTLKLPGLVINAFSTVYNISSEVFTTYIADATSGLVILETPQATWKTTVSTMFLLGNDTMAIGACPQAGILAVANKPGDVYEYDISGGYDAPVFQRTYPRHSNVNNTYTAQGPNIACSSGSDPNFWALTVASEVYTMRILDRHSDWESSVFVDIPISTVASYENGKIQWLNPWTVTGIGCSQPILKSYFLRRQNLVIPELTEGEFTTLKKNNGDSGNFYI